MTTTNDDHRIEAIKLIAVGLCHAETLGLCQHGCAFAHCAAPKLYADRAASALLSLERAGWFVLPPVYADRDDVDSRPAFPIEAEQANG